MRPAAEQRAVRHPLASAVSPFALAAFGLRCRCAACGVYAPRQSCEHVGDVSFCDDCMSQSRLDELSGLYDDLGGGD